MKTVSPRVGPKNISDAPMGTSFGKDGLHAQVRLLHAPGRDQTRRCLMTDLACLRLVDVERRDQNQRRRSPRRRRAACKAYSSSVRKAMASPTNVPPTNAMMGKLGLHEIASTTNRKRCRESFCDLGNGHSFDANRKKLLYHYPGLNADSSVTPRAAPARLFHIPYSAIQ
jgi:hypothetical protein